MRRILLLGLIVFTAGCSNAPIAGLCDCLAPNRAGRNEGGHGPVVPEIRPDDRPVPRIGPDAATLPPPADLPPTSPRP